MVVTMIITMPGDISPPPAKRSTSARINPPASCRRVAPPTNTSRLRRRISRRCLKKKAEAPHPRPMPVSRTLISRPPPALVTRPSLAAARIS